MLELFCSIFLSFTTPVSMQYEVMRYVPPQQLLSIQPSSKAVNLPTDPVQLIQLAPVNK